MVSYLPLLSHIQVQILLKTSQNTIRGILKIDWINVFSVLSDCKDGSLVTKVGEISPTEAIGESC